MDKVVTEEEDRKVEEDKIRKALKQCGYPEWTVDKVKTDKVSKQGKPKPRKEKNKATTRRTLVTVPYIQGLTEKPQWIYQSHQISTAVRPLARLRKMLVHPKDKIDIDNVTGCVYMKSHVTIVKRLTLVKHVDCLPRVRRNIKMKLEE